MNTKVTEVEFSEGIIIAFITYIFVVSVIIHGYLYKFMHIMV